jgi:hypothetical protein
MLHSKHFLLVTLSELIGVATVPTYTTLPIVNCSLGGFIILAKNIFFLYGVIKNKND